MKNNSLLLISHSALFSKPYKNWYETYNLMPRPVNFWDFVDSVEAATLGKTERIGLIVQMYRIYLTDHPLVSEYRISPEILMLIEDRGNGWRGFMIGAKERIRLSLYPMVMGGGEFSDAWFDAFYERYRQRLRLPEDDRLQSRHIFERCQTALYHILHNHLDERE